MKSTTTTLIVFCLFVCSILFAPFILGGKPEDVMTGVTELTDQNFDTFIKSNKYVLVEFYAPWCGHCQAFSTSLAKLGKVVSESKRSDIKIAKVDGDKYESLSNRLNLEGFPTIYLFKDGNLKNPISHDGPMTAKGVLDFIYENSKQ
ncbi:hypothetical protein FDP41_012443 [Naegleria fowleri]|uniref:Thioredoxin domain-containing protein n=1 Tax=Naegleria fowleri TaxID=5763 RepID=A0A6A5C283_NAEFO|nr:uncharacterized protein FDP41_012443 [Naegleria fowleri]KAF0981786.1 hypothetical protein FDP41_012443 [Naegleria fowleri]